MFNTQEQLNFHLGRFLDWGQHGYVGGDDGLRSIFDILQCFHDIAPVYSCEGHYDSQVWDTFYIMFVCNANGFEILRNIQNRIIDKLQRLEEPATEAALVNKTQQLTRSVRLTLTRRASAHLKISSMPVVILDAGKRATYNTDKEPLLKAVLESTQEELDIYKATVKQTWLAAPI